MRTSIGRLMTGSFLGACQHQAVKAELDGVLLDLDGTLLDHREAAAAAALQWARALPGWDEDEAADTRWTQLERRYFPLYLCGELTFQEQRRLRVRAFHASLSTLDDAEADRQFDDYLTRYRSNWRAFPDVAGFLRRVHNQGLMAGVLTNGNASQQREKLEAILPGSGLMLLASSELGFAKPSPESFQAACARLGIRPKRTVMIGDDRDVDVLGARRAGLQALHLDRGAGGVGGEVVDSLEAAGRLLLA
jgi:putative hydrolase of the HAD superfamily